MILSDRSLRAALESGRIKMDPLAPDALQPSSIDIRLDRTFRVFANHRYPYIDVRAHQPELTDVVNVADDEPFILHPGEFVLGATYERVTLPNDLVARLEGKALAVGTPVPTPDGWRTIGELRVGDKVFDERGSPSAVVAATEMMLGRPCREVLFSDGQSIIVDATHQWLTSTKAERRYGKPAAVRTTEDIARTLVVRGERNHQVPLTLPVRYPRQPLPIDPYVLGVWLGDGTSKAAEITCGSGDEQVLEEIRSAGYAVWPAAGARRFHIGGLSRDKTERLRHPQTGRYLSDGSLSSTLRALGLLGDKQLPGIYLIGDLEQRLALLQGLMDSDGYVDVQGRCEFVNTRQHLADAVAELAASLGFRPVKWKKRVSLYGVDRGHAYQVKFTPHAPVFRLKRKLARQKPASFHASRAIAAVRPVPSVPVRCIQVSSARGLFLVGPTFIPTHNSSLGRLGLLIHSTAGFVDPGFDGYLTLELSNVATLPIAIYAQMKIGQLAFFMLDAAAEHPYGSREAGSKYQGQQGPTASRYYLNFSDEVTGRP